MVLSRLGPLTGVTLQLIMPDCNIPVTLLIRGAALGALARAII